MGVGSLGSLWSLAALLNAACVTLYVHRKSAQHASPPGVASSLGCFRTTLDRNTEVPLQLGEHCCSEQTGGAAVCA
jgi:hypothetical protein